MKEVTSIEKIELHIDEEKNSAKLVLHGGGRAFTLLVEDVHGQMQPVSIAEIENDPKAV